MAERPGALTETASEIESREAVPEWAELASEAVESLSRIMRAEIRVLEMAVRNTVSAEVDRVLKASIALVLISLGTICGLIGIIFLLHTAFGEWWPGLLIVAGLMLTAGIALFISGPRRSALS